jgi:hypothetical protein
LSSASTQRRKCRRQWQFTPTTLNGHASIMTVTVNFTLQ